MKLKLLFYTPIHLGYGAGFEEWLSKVCYVINSKVDSSVLFGNIDGHLRWDKKTQSSKYKNIQVREIKYYNLFSLIYLPTLSSFKIIYKEFKKNDIIYYNCSFIFHDLIVVFLALVTKKRIVFGFHAPIFFDNKIHNLYVKWITMYLLRLVDACHVLNQKDERILRDKNKNVFKIHNFLLKTDLPGKETSNFYGEFLFVGRYDYQKSIDLLCPAIELVLKKNSDLQFTFYGSGQQRMYLDNLKKKFPLNIKIYDYEKNKDIIYRNKKYLILPSRQESFPMVALEAMSYGLPMIASKIPGLIDIVSDKKDGFFIKNISIEEIARSIDLASNVKVKDYLRMTKEAFNKPSKLYNDRTFLEKFYNMLDMVKTR